MSKNFLDMFDRSDIEGISALIDKLEKSSFDYLKLESEGMSIIIGKNGAGEVSANMAPPAVTVNAAPVSVPTAIDTAPAAVETAPAHVQPPPVTKTDSSAEEGIVVIKSPSYGLFYSQPEPGASPYITVGKSVKTGDTIGLVEIMKTFNAIASPIDGVVMAIHVRNEEVLEPNQPLVSILVK